MIGAWAIAVALTIASPPESERLAYLERSLAESEGALSCWYWSWLAGYSALAVGQAVPGLLAGRIEDAPSRADALRASLLVGATTSAVGAVVLGLSYPAGLGATDLLALMPEETEEQRATKLALAESLLRKTAEQEAFGTGWIAHLGNAGLNLIAGLVLWLGFDQLEDGLVTAGSGWAVGAVQIFTQPTRAIDDWAEYKRRFEGTPDTAETAWNWSIGLFPGGVGLVVTM